MTSERWQAVEEIYHAASDRPVEERAAFLAQACKGDDELRRDVEELPRRSDGVDSLLDGPLRRLFEDPELQPGQVLGRIGARA